jgi:Cys-rich repeat protein
MRACSLSLVAVTAALVALVASGCPGEVDTGGQACSATQPCTDGLACQDGQCIARCTDGGCADGLCDLTSGLCVDCLDSTQCPDGFVCNDFTNRCVQPVQGCTQDSECGGLHCDTLKGSCVQCLEDGHCGLGSVCDLITQTCATKKSCVTDGDCSDTVCDPGSHVCVECFNDAHCGSGTCDLGTNTCVVGCVDNDVTEPNDGDDATVITDGGAHEGAICPGDVDEFVIDAAGTLAATLTIDGAAALQLRLLNASGSLVTAGTANAGGLALTANNLASGTYRLVVQGTTSSASGSYLLSVDVRQPASCTQLDDEPNNTTGTSQDITPDNTLVSGAICGADTDVFRFTAAAGDDLEATVIPGDGAGTLTLAILNGSGNVVATGNPATLADVTAGTFFARVTATGGDVSYSIRVQATSAPPVCNQTDAEPNNADAQALALTPGTPASGTICAGDVDQFRFAAAALDDVRVTVTGTGVQAKLVRAVDGVQVASGLTMNAANVDAGGYRVVVQGTNGTSEGNYTVNVQITPEPAPDPCTEGGLEPDSRTSPRTLALDGTPLAGRICASDTDFYSFTLGFRSTVTIHSHFTDANGDLDMRLTDSTGATITTSAGITDDETIVRTLDPGTYGVEMFGFLGALNTFTIDATLSGCTPDDGFEVNNTFASATPIGASAVNAARCPGDDDFFLVRLETGDSVSAALTGNGLTMSLVSATNGAVVANDSANGGSRRLTVSGLPAGRYAFRVTGSGTDRVAYTLTPGITASPSRCIDDGAQPNDTSATAFLLDNTGLQDGSYDVGDLVSCSIGDQDWFRIALPGGKKVALQLAFDPAKDVDIELLEPRAATGLTRRIARSFATNKQDRVEGLINAGGEYLIKGAGFESTQTSYKIGVEVSDPPASSCTDDRFDTWTATDDTTTPVAITNNTSLDAVQLSAGEFLPNMRICPNNEDWYVLSANAGQHIVIHVDYAHAAGRDIDIRLFNSSSQTEPNQVASSVGTDGTEDIDFTVVTSGNHFLKVFGFQGGENAYDLSVDVR